jgi:recombination protein RecT
MSENKQVQIRPVDQLKKVLENTSVKEQFANAMRENAQLFTASLIELFTGDTGLQKCAPSLVVMEALKAATLKLPLNRNLGFAWIVVYNKSYRDQDGQWQKQPIPQFQVGWRGYEQLAMRTGKYTCINCGPVLEGELKSIDKLSGMIDISGEPKSEEEVGYFAHFELVNGFKKTLYWPKEKIEKHAIKYNPECKKKGALSGNWKEHFSSRAASTVLKHLLKNYGIMSIEMNDAFGKDEEQQNYFDAEYSDLANTTPLISDDATQDEIIEAETADGESIDTDTGEVIQDQEMRTPPYELVD